VVLDNKKYFSEQILFDKESFGSIFQEIQHLVSQKRSRVRDAAGDSVLDAMQVPESRSTLRKKLYLLEGKFDIL